MKTIAIVERVNVEQIDKFDDEEVGVKKALIIWKEETVLSFFRRKKNNRTKENEKIKQK